MRNLILPFVERLKKSQLNRMQETLVDILEQHLGELTTSFTRTLGLKAVTLTPSEIWRGNLFMKEIQTEKPIAREGLRPAPPSILIVDDVPANLELLAMKLFLVRF